MANAPSQMLLGIYTCIYWHVMTDYGTRGGVIVAFANFKFTLQFKQVNSTNITIKLAKLHLSHTPCPLSDSKV